MTAEKLNLILTVCLCFYRYAKLFLKLLLGKTKNYLGKTKNYKLLFLFVSIFVSRNIAIESRIFLGMKKLENVGSSLDAGKRIWTSFTSNFYLFC
jgi:hypothetical protein